MDTKRTDNNDAVSQNANEQPEARKLLGTVCSTIFEGNLAEVALALGRDEATLKKMLEGEVTIDEDLVMKMHGLVEQRGGG